MRTAEPETPMLFKFSPHTLLCLLPLLMTPALRAAEAPQPICQYRTIDIDAQTGDIQFIAPVQIGPEDCLNSGAALAELDPSWRQRLPPRVRWTQLKEAPQLCRQTHTTWGQRMQLLPDQGCVFLQSQVACNIVTAQAVSHAQLANAVRSCVP